MKKSESLNYIALVIAVLGFIAFLKGVYTVNPFEQSISVSLVLYASILNLKSEILKRDSE